MDYSRVVMFFYFLGYILFIISESRLQVFKFTSISTRKFPLFLLFLELYLISLTFNLNEFNIL